MRPLQFSEVFGDELGVVKTASANVAVDSGEGNDDRGGIRLW